MTKIERAVKEVINELAESYSTKGKTDKRHATTFYRKWYAEDIKTALAMTVDKAPMYINSTSPILIKVCRLLLGVKETSGSN